jgi:hypothetical protein
MNAWNRVIGTLLAAGAAGFLLWLAAQFDLKTTGGYWAAMGVVAGCGLLLAAAQIRGGGGNPPAMLLVDFLPVLICAGWVLLYAQPHGNWFRNHVSAWSGDIGIRDVVHDIAMWNGVLAFGIGLVFGYALEPGMLRRRRAVAAEPAVDTATADEPTLAEREERTATPTTTRSVERTQTTVR